MNFNKCPFTFPSCQDGERKLWWKRSPSPSAFWEMRPSPRLLLSCSLSERRGRQEKCQASFWREFASFNDGWQRWKARRKPPHWSSHGNYSKKQMSWRSRGPSPRRSCKPPLALKNRTSLNCATRRLYQGVEWGAPKDQSFAAEELLTGLGHRHCCPAYQSSRLSRRVPTTTTPVCCCLMRACVVRKHKNTCRKHRSNHKRWGRKVWRRLWLII